jgi:hypothetical protein
MPFSKYSQYLVGRISANGIKMLKILMANG